MKTELDAKLAELIYHNETNYYTIALFETEEAQFCGVGNLPFPQKGRNYRLLGDWTVHPKYGEQFAFTSFEEIAPTSLDGIAAFLASGTIRGVGPATAAAITAHFKEDTLRILEQEPERLTEISGIGPVRAESIADGYAQHIEYAKVVMALAKYEIDAATSMKLYKAYGKQAVSFLEENPYRLIEDVFSIGFHKADKIAGKMGFSQDSPFRVKSGILYYLSQRAQNGDSYVPRTELIQEVAEFLEVQRDMLEDPLLELVMGAKIICEILEGEEIVMLFSYHRAECKAAERFCALCTAQLPHFSMDIDRQIEAEEKRSGIVLSEKQKDAVRSSLKNGVSVITGGPGTGKTTIIRTILSLLSFCGVKTALAAPTGRAAKRMTETTGQQAFTIHRLLEYYYSDDADCMKFGKTEEDPLDYDCIIIDEMSMVDIMLMDGLLKAITPGTRLILSGDADQLPPVGAGSVLADIISSETVHVTRLTEIFRQARESLIVVNAHQINKGEYPSYNVKDKDFFFLERKRTADITATIAELCRSRLPSYYDDLNAYTDIQVLTPVRKGPLGCIELNRLLQGVLNPPSADKPEKTLGDRTFRKGDKVMQIKNNYQLEWKDISDGTDGSGVFNGDVGIVQTVDTENGIIHVLYDQTHLVSYDYTAAAELETAFAMTVHKSQGSEFPVVVLPMSSFPPMLANRNLLYTAITRAKTGVVIVGIPAMLNAMVDNNSVVKRYSGLAARLRRLWGFSDDGELL